jgi:hypothetical protein
MFAYSMLDIMEVFTNPVNQQKSNCNCSTESLEFFQLLCAPYLW